MATLQTLLGTGSLEGKELFRHSQKPNEIEDYEAWATVTTERFVAVVNGRLFRFTRQVNNYNLGIVDEEEKNPPGSIVVHEERIGPLNSVKDLVANDWNVRDRSPDLNPVADIRKRVIVKEEILF
jgi:hypothetical protein